MMAHETTLFLQKHGSISAFAMWKAEQEFLRYLPGMSLVGISLFSLTLAALIYFGRRKTRHHPRRTASALVSINASAEEVTTVWMPMLVTLVLLSAALFVVLSKRYDDTTQKWAFGTLGTIVGFWLKSVQSTS